MGNIYCFISDEPFLLQENRLIEINKLKKLGHKIQYDLGGFGGYQAIMRVDGVYYGASESRKDGHASGY